jgi:renalase
VATASILEESRCQSAGSGGKWFPMMRGNVAVIGAGMAGVSAARRLREAGWGVVVFEKSRGWGGRCATKRIEGCAVDHGAQFFTLRDPAFRAAVEAASSDNLCAIEAPVVDSGGRPIEEKTLFYHALGNSRLARDLGAGLDVRTAHEITAIDQLSIEGTRFDFIVSTAPLPQTQRLAGVAVTSNPYTPCLALILLYNGNWPGTTRQRYAVRGHGALEWSACENHKSGRIPPGTTAMVAHGSAEFSRTHLEADPGEWSQILRGDVERRWEIPSDALRSFHPHRWRYARRAIRAAPTGLPTRWIFAGDLLTESRVESAWIAGRDAVASLL